MPRGDGTGPMGMGSMTGRAAGFCAGYGVPGFANPGFGRGFGMGAGRGRGLGTGGGFGWRNRYYATGMTGWQRGELRGYPTAVPADQDQELDVLKNQTRYFEETLKGVRRRIEELEAQKGV